MWQPPEEKDKPKQVSDFLKRLEALPPKKYQEIESYIISIMNSKRHDLGLENIEIDAKGTVNYQIKKSK